MNGVLIVAHGSRIESTRATIEDVVARVQELLPELPLEIAYMEFDEPRISQSAQALIDRGVDAIKVVPYFLFEGIHIRKNIPHELQEALRDHPHIKFTMSKALGSDPRLADILADRIRE